MCKAFDWKHSRISMLEVEAILQSCISLVQIGLSIVLYMRSLLLVECFDLHASNQYILVMVILSCFHFAKICLCQVSLLSTCSPRYLTSSSWGSCTLFLWTGGHVSVCVVNVTWINLDSLAFILHFLNQFWFASRSGCSLCEAMVGSLSVATTAVSSAKFAVVDCGEVGRPAVYSRYNNGLRTLAWGTPALTEDSSVHSDSFMRKKS
jgi:hypothetical protein